MKPKTIDGYLKNLPRSARAALAGIRRTIRKAAPGAEELISYRMPAFRWRGRIVAYVGAFTHHIGFFPPPPKTLRKAAARYAGPKGNLRFPLDRPMPLALVKRIIRYKVKERSKSP